MEENSHRYQRRRVEICCFFVVFFFVFERERERDAKGVRTYVYDEWWDGWGEAKSCHVRAIHMYFEEIVL